MRRAKAGSAVNATRPARLTRAGRLRWNRTTAPTRIPGGVTELPGRRYRPSRDSTDLPGWKPPRFAERMSPGTLSKSLLFRLKIWLPTFQG